MTLRHAAIFGLALAAAPAAPSGLRAQGTPPVEYGYSLPSEPMGELPKARECQTSLPTFGHPDQQFWPPHATIAMSADGGWCWVQFASVIRTLKFTPEATLGALPAHGQAEVARMADRVSVAYRPAPGFTGSDAFEVQVAGPFPHTVPFSVTVR